MKSEQFETTKQESRFDEFFEVALAFDGLTMEDYKTFIPSIFEIVPDCTERNPILMYESIIETLRDRWTASSQLPFHGPWHHGLVAGIIIATLRNNGFAFDNEDITEALKRGLMIPGGGCGMHGTCGAATGVGIALSIANKATPFHDGQRSESLEVVAEAIRRIAKLGGPRCCALSTYTTLNLAVSAFKKKGFVMESTPVAGCCSKHALNSECHLARCPYFPRERN